MKIAKALQGRQQQAVGDRGIGDASAGIGGEPGGLQGTYGGQPLVVVLLAKQGQSLQGAVALQIREAGRYVGETDLAIGVFRVRRQEGGQGSAGIPWTIQQIDRAGGEVQGALARGHQQGALARLGQAQRRRQARHATTDDDVVKFHEGSP
ncbi:hypothetical protein D3C79_859850 [compost metagenome]